MIKPNDITGVVLAGGKSSRFGSNKALCMQEGKSFVQLAIELLKPFAKEVVVAGFYPEYSQLNVPILKDELPHIGPLGGIYTALNYCSTPWMLVATCDMPNMKPLVIEQLLAQRKEEEKIIGWGSSQHAVSFPLLISTEIMPDLQQCINQEEYRVKRLFEKDYAKTINIPEQWMSYFANINRQVEHDA